jgi:hypothetical protein
MERAKLRYEPPQIIPVSDLAKAVGDAGSVCGGGSGGFGKPCNAGDQGFSTTS